MSLVRNCESRVVRALDEWIKVKQFEFASVSPSVNISIEILFKETNKYYEIKCGRLQSVNGATVAPTPAIHVHHHVDRLIEFLNYAHRTHDTKSAK